METAENDFAKNFFAARLLRRIEPRFFKFLFE